MCGQSKSVGVVDDENVYVQAAQRIEAQSKAPSTFDPIDSAFPKVVEALSAGDVEGARRIAAEASNASLEPYYLGRGAFDHDRFLADLAKEKGSALNEAELRLFGRAVGTFTGDKLGQEVNAGKLSFEEGLLISLGVIA